MSNRNKPVAKTQRPSAPRKSKRPLGLAKGALKVPEEFFKPLPASVIKAFWGERL